MNSRRTFLAAGAGLLTAVSGRAAKTSYSSFPYSEFETRIARRDFRDITKDVLPTPCMVLDLEMFNQNVRRMSDQAKSTGINVRPHVKIHKSVDVGKRQVAQVVPHAAPGEEGAGDQHARRALVCDPGQSQMVSQFGSIADCRGYDGRAWHGVSEANSRSRRDKG